MKNKQANQDYFKCFKCSFETSKLADYQAHKMDHFTGKAGTVGAPLKPQSIGPVEMPDEIMQDLLPKPPVVEAPVVPPEPPKPVVAPIPPVKPVIEKRKDPEKIKLAYKYEGVHECGHEIDTLFIDIEDKYVVVAYCNSCKEQIMSRPVSKL